MSEATRPAATQDPDDAKRALLAANRRVTVFGLSPKPERDSHRVARYLQAVGYDVVGVNPVAPAIEGFVMAAPEDIEPLGIVDVFRGSEHVPAIVETIIDRQPAALWLQLGVRHPQAEARAAAAGIPVFTGECILVAHSRLMPAPALDAPDTAP